MRVPRPTYAGVTATLALVIALGGGAYAATSLPKNSVGSKQLKKNAVVSAKLKTNAVTGAKVKDGSLTGADVNASTLGTVPSATHATSADNAGHAGSADTAGSTANAGHAGAAAALDHVTKVSAPETAPSNDVGTGTVNCPAGQRATGGGAQLDDDVDDYIEDTFPNADGAGWTTRVYHGTTGPGTYTAYAICVAGGS
jgi:hypothetical protein